MQKRKTLMAVLLLAILIVSLMAIPTMAASKAGTSDVGMGLGWASMIWGAYTQDPVAIALGMAGYYLAVGSAALLLPSGGVSVGGVL
jgi:hypothetical protein